MPLTHMPSRKILYLPDLSPYLKSLRASQMAQATYPLERKSCAPATLLSWDLNCLKNYKTTSAI